MAPAAVFFLCLVASWEACVRANRIPSYLLPAPSAALAELDASLLGHAWVTLSEAVLGFIVANGLAFVAAVVFAHSTLVERCVFPLAVAMKTTPLAALAPLLVIWLGTGMASKVAASALLSFFPTLVNGVKGFKTIEREAGELFSSYGATRFETLRFLRLPSALPYLLSGMKISTSLSVVGAIVGEFVGASQGLGYVVLVSSYHMDTAAMFAAIFCSAAIGLGMFSLVARLERLIVFWHEVDPS